MSAGINIEIGWPAKALSPNARSRSHWPRTNALKAAKKEGYGAALLEVGTTYKHPGEGPIKVVITAYPKVQRNRDADNLIASVKGHLDGIAKALGVDDSRFDPRVQWAEPVANPRVVICIGGGA